LGRYSCGLLGRRTGGDGAGTKLNLFDIDADPYEQDDLSAAYPEVVQKLKQKLLVWDGANPATPDPACRMDD